MLGFDSGRIKKIVGQTNHSQGRALYGFHLRAFADDAFLRWLAETKIDPTADDGQRGPQVVSNDGENVIAASNRIQRLRVDAGILNRYNCSAGKIPEQDQIIPGV